MLSNEERATARERGMSTFAHDQAHAGVSGYGRLNAMVTLRPIGVRSTCLRAAIAQDAPDLAVAATRPHVLELSLLQSPFRCCVQQRGAERLFRFLPHLLAKRPLS